MLKKICKIKPLVLDVLMSTQGFYVLKQICSLTLLVKVCMTLQWTPDTKGLIYKEGFPMALNQSSTIY